MKITSNGARRPHYFHLDGRNSTLSSERSSHEASQSGQSGGRGSSTNASLLTQDGVGENEEENIEEIRTRSSDTKLI